MFHVVIAGSVHIIAQLADRHVAFHITVSYNLYFLTYLLWGACVALLVGSLLAV